MKIPSKRITLYIIKSDSQGNNQQIWECKLDFKQHKLYINLHEVYHTCEGYNINSPSQVLLGIPRKIETSIDAKDKYLVPECPASNISWIICIIKQSVFAVHSRTNY